MAAPCRHSRRWLRGPPGRPPPSEGAGLDHARRSAELLPLPAARLSSRDRRALTGRDRDAVARDRQAPGERQGRARRSQSRSTSRADRIFLDRLPSGREQPRSRMTRSSSPPARATRTSAIREWQAHAPELKSLDGALEIRSRILTAFEAAEVEEDASAAARAGSRSSSSAAARPASRWRPDRRARPRDAVARLPLGRIRARRASSSSRPASACSTASPSLCRATRPATSSGSASRRSSGTQVAGIAADSVAIRGPCRRCRAQTAARTVIWAAGVHRIRPRRDARPRGGSRDRSRRTPTRRARPHARRASRGHRARRHGQRPGRRRDAAGLPGLAPVAIQQGRYAAKRHRSPPPATARRARSATATRATSRRSAAPAPSPTSEASISPGSRRGSSGSPSISST